MEHCCASFFTLKRELRNATETFALPECTRLLVTPYGVAPRPLNCLKEPSARVNQGAHSKVALFLGRVHPKKRPDLLIKAWRGAGVGHEWRLVIAGDGDKAYLARLRKLVRLLKLEDVIQFVGAVAGADKQYLFQRASWFLLPSEQENFGIAVIEAIQAGCAIAVSDQVYLSDEFPAGSEILPVRLDAWVKFMHERMPDEIWRSSQARRVSEVLLPKFDSVKVAENWMSIIETVMGKATNG